MQYGIYLSTSKPLIMSWSDWLGQMSSVSTGGYFERDPLQVGWKRRI